MLPKKERLLKILESFSIWQPVGVSASDWEDHNLFIGRSGNGLLVEVVIMGYQTFIPPKIVN